MKVYCNNCSYSRTYWGDSFSHCFNKETRKEYDTAESHEVYNQLCRDINKNNNCKYYEKISISSFKILDILMGAGVIAFIVYVLFFSFRELLMK